MIQENSIHLGDAAALFEAQGGRCAICRNEPEDRKRLCIDHNHTSGAVRGLLWGIIYMTPVLSRNAPDLAESRHFTSARPRVSFREIQRLTINRFGGFPLDQQAIYFETLTGFRYRLTHFEVEDGRPVWLHGYRGGEGEPRAYTSRTPDELTPESIVGLR